MNIREPRSGADLMHKHALHDHRKRQPLTPFMTLKCIQEIDSRKLKDSGLAKLADWRRLATWGANWVMGSMGLFSMPVPNSLCLE